MKKFIAVIILTITATSFTFAQENEPTFEKQDDLVKATYYHDNGMVKEEGFFKGDKLHDKWVHYNENGKVKIIAFYKNGMKDGKWYLIDEKSVKEVTYSLNKIVDVKQVEAPNLSFI